METKFRDDSVRG